MDETTHQADPLTSLLRKVSSQVPTSNSPTFKRLSVLLAVGVLALYVYAMPYAHHVWERSICRQFSATLATFSIPVNTCATVAVLALDGLYIAVFATIAGVLLWRRANERVALIGALALLTFGAGTPFPLLQLVNEQPMFALPVGFITALGLWLLLLFFYRFPDGRLVPRWFKWLVPVWTLTIIVIWLRSMNSSILDSPLNLYLILGWYATGLAGQLYRYRRVAPPDQRQQTKWVVFGIVIALALYIPSILLVQFVRVNDSPGGLLFTFGVWALRYAALLVVPISIGLSILRFRLWGIDLVISRTVVIGLFTSLLGAAFFVVLIIVEQVITMMTGGQNAMVAGAAGTLAVAALFQPTRLWMKKTIERRLYPTLLRRALASSVVTAPINRSTDTTAVSLIGQQIGHYRVIKGIGRGGMADVFLGQHTSLNRAVAIKVLTVLTEDTEELQQRFEREATVIAGLHHPNIVQLLDYGKFANHYYMIIEYVGGPDLHHYLKQQGALRLDQAAPLLRDIAAALDYAHMQAIVHRDIKPSNILLRPETAPDGSTCYRAVLSDFGLAKLLESKESFTKSGTIGTFDYIAPEQIINAREVDQRADIYALGVVIYQMLTGQLPFRGDGGVADILLGHLNRPAPDPRTWEPSIPEHVAEAILRALAKDPANRPPSADALVTEVLRMQQIT